MKLTMPGCVRGTKFRAALKRNHGFGPDYGMQLQRGCALVYGVTTCLR